MPAVLSGPQRRAATVRRFALLLLCAIAPDVPAAAFGDTQRAEVVAALEQRLQNDYVDAERGAQMARELRARHAGGDYDGLDEAAAFAEQLSRELQAASGDVHLRVEFSPEPLPPQEGGLPPELAAMEREAMRQGNYGIERVERLRFNLGYLQLHAFAPVDLVAPRFAAAMTLLADTRALIVDLRQNRGGEPEAVALLASYLLDARTHLGDIESRHAPRQAIWSQRSVQGPRYTAARPVYVLISRATVSAGEDFAYTLQQLDRVVVVGEPSAGAAGQGELQRLTEHFLAFVPGARSVNAVSGGNWGGTGVTPDLAVAPERAVEAAQAHILRRLIATESDQATRERMVGHLQALEPTTETIGEEAPPRPSPR